MLKIKLIGEAVAFSKQIDLICKNFSVTIANDGICVDCKKSNDGMTVTKKANNAIIIYEKDCEFFRGILTLMENEDDFEIHEKAGFKFNGEMLDNSRNSVLTIETAKKIIIYSAMIGLDNILLYNEETFEVNNNPYFGYMRMGYTQKDVRDLTDFAKEFGVTIIPCIQTLAHLAQALRWKCYWDITDHGDTILVEEEKTYALIEEIVKSWRGCVDTNIINIGMDEAFYLGRGQYLDKNGFKDHFKLMCDHLTRVLEICKKYDFKAMMWSDMFFRCIFGDYYTEGEIDPELIKLVPTDVTLIYWDYYSTDEGKYDRLIKQHQKFKNEIAFAGGAWKWSGIVPAINHSHEVSKMALSAAKKNGVSTVFTTAWGDNGAEASIFTILPTLILHGEVSYCNENVDEKVSSKLKALTGYTLSEFFLLCEPNKTPENNLIPHFNPCKYLFFQDVLMGLFDYHVRENFPQFFADCHKKLEVLANKNSNLSYLFDTISKLCNVLELKCDIGLRLKKAYEEKNNNELKNLANVVIPEMIARIEIYYIAFKKQWYNESKSGGFDTQDIHFGGLIRRILTAQETVNNYISGNIASIEELEQPRLPFDCRKIDKNDTNLTTECNFWNYIVTPNVNGRF